MQKRFSYTKYVTSTNTFLIINTRFYCILIELYVFYYMNTFLIINTRFYCIIIELYFFYYMNTFLIINTRF